MAARKIELSKADRKQARKWYEEGYSVASIAEDFGISIPTMRRELEEAGTKIRERGGKGRSK